MSSCDQLLSGEYGFIFECGYMAAVTKVKVSDVACIIRTVALNLTAVGVKSELDQLSEGLQLFQVHELLKSHPKKCQSLFIQNTWCKQKDHHCWESNQGQLSMLYYRAMTRTNASLHNILYVYMSLITSQSPA